MTMASVICEIVLAVLLGRVDGAVAGVPLGPDEEEDVLTIRILMDLVDELACRCDRMTIYLKDDVARLQAGVFGRTAGTHVLNDSAIELIRSVDLLPEIGCEVAYTDSELPSFLRAIVVVVRHIGVLLELSNGDVERGRVAVTQDAERDVASRSDLANGDLKGAAVDDLLTIDRGDDIAPVDSAFACGRVGRDLRDDSAGRLFQIEEMGVGRRDIVKADAQIAVIDMAVLHQLLCGGTYDL